MVVLIHPSDHLLSPYLIDACLLEGYEVAMLEVGDELLFRFGRNANFKNISDSDEKPGDIQFGLFINQKPDVQVEKSILITDQPIDDKGEAVETVLSTEFVEWKKEDPRLATEKGVGMKDFAEWIAKHIFTETFPPILYINGQKEKQSIHFIAESD